MDLGPIITTVNTIVVAFVFQAIGAIALWVVGRWLINMGTALIRRSLKGQPVDATVVNYTVNIVSVALQIILIVAILGFFGVETTSFAALLAAAGVAIGAAWSGLLANFAAGVFLVIFRPFKVGDFICAGGVTGTVQEIGLFVTSITTLDNVLNIVANNKIFADNIQNFSVNPYRRVDLVAQLNHSVDPKEAINLLKTRLSQIPNVISAPAPDVEILEFNLAGPVLAVRPYCNNEHYWQVYFDTNMVIRESFGQAGFPTPEYHYAIRQG
ncbi:MAG: mechanosensitive ion channel family protein [Leptolyngbyaceae cyanobacterium bins.59]|nr:mechanosensitive ion channel family protein [Leptolyngbyaceae cyanobacterium bins.59]